MNVLIIESRAGLGTRIKNHLVEQRYAVTWARGGRDACQILYSDRYDGVILDEDLPDGGGLEFLEAWRQNGLDEPVVFMGRGRTVADRIRALDRGADSYLTKPFEIRELTAHLRALFRRSASPRVRSLHCRGITLDLDRRTASIDGRRIELRRQELSILELLMRNPGRFIAKNLILRQIPSAKPSGNPQALLYVHLSHLRKKLETPENRPLFRVSRGFGYQIVADGKFSSPSA